jgi:uncharacterized protein
MKVEYIPSNVKYKLNLNWKLLVSIILITIFLISNIIIAIISNDFYNKNFTVSLSKGVNQHDTYLSTFNADRFNSLEKEDVSIISKYGYTVYGTFIKNPKPSKSTIILVNGSNGSRWSMMKYLDMYINKGFNVLAYDSRDCGQSGGDDLSYGYFEKYDLDKWVDWVVYATKKIVTPTAAPLIIGVHGDSTGGSTALLHTTLNANDFRVRFYIDDSSYSNLESLMKTRLEKELHTDNKYVINYFMLFISGITSYRSNIKLQDVSPLKAVKDISTPILFINNKNDAINPLANTMDLYTAKMDKKSIYIPVNSGTGSAFDANKDEYVNNVYKFIDSVTATIK